VAEMILLLKNKENLSKKHIILITFWIIEDYDDVMLQEIENLIKYFKKDVSFNVEWNIINFTKLNIYRCQACNICPWIQNKKSFYKCRIKNDDFATIYKGLVNTDAIIICAYQPTKFKNGKSVYQRVLERTRQIRRDNFLLTNIPITSLSIEEIPNNSLFSLKVMTSFLRHNTVIYPPLKIYLYKGKRIISCEELFLDFIKFSFKLARAREILCKERPVYLPIGYTT